MISKERLVFDTANASEGDVVAAFLKAADGTLITHTGGALDVNVANAVAVSGSVTVSATDLDIRDLAFATDKVDVSGSEVALDAATLAALENITVSGAVTVSATDLDVRDLAFATDKVDVSGSSVSISGDVNVTQGTSPWVVSGSVDASGSAVSLDAATLAALENVTVSATDLDIRDLAAASDSVSAWMKDGAGTALTSTTAGAKQALDVNITNGIDVYLDGVYDGSTNTTPDSVGAILHARGASPDKTSQTFRTTGGSPSSDNLDPANIHAADTNAFAMGWDGSAWDRLQATAGSLNVNVTSADPALANAALTSAAASVSSTSAALLASQASGRKYLIAQNLGSKSIYVGASGVSTSTGIRLSPGSSMELRLGPAVSLHAVTDSGTQDTRLLEIA